MGWSTPRTWTTTELVTAANLNTYVSDDLSDLHRRTNPDGTTVATSETTTSTSYADLATSGPAVTLTTGTMALVILTCQMSNNTAGQSAIMGFAVSGASTIAATDTKCLAYQSSANNEATVSTAAYLIETLTAGSNTFTAKYRVSANTGTFLNRNLAVVPLGAA